jgi:hypothetical protein
MSKFLSCQNKGFQLTFQNGWTVSVQWGPGNYCDRQSFSVSEFSAPLNGSGFWTSEHAEVAAWNSNGEWLPFEHDTVKGWNSTDEVAAFVAKVAALPADLHPGKPKGWDTGEKNETE